MVNGYMDIVTIEQALREGVQLLEQSGVQSDTLKLDCEILLLSVLNQNQTVQKTKTWLLTWPEYTLSEQQFSLFQNYLQQRASGKPVAYITGEKAFWSFVLKVTPDTLIPRPETELLVECALDTLSADKPASVLDLGTGSGAIALAIAGERPDYQVVAGDFSAAALEVARHNARQLQLNNVQFYQSDWFTDIPKQVFDLIVSNPPYIAADDQQLEDSVREFEPSGALLSEQNGLRDIEQIIQASKGYLKAGGWLMLEHGFAQDKAVRGLFQQSGFINIATIEDLNKLPRVTMGQFGSW